MNDEKMLMFEAATLYYEKKYTQQEIADVMHLSRQTVSNLLNDAVKEQVVRITVHDPAATRTEMETALCHTFGIREAVVCGVSGPDETLRRLMPVKAAAQYLMPDLQKGGQNIAVSWGHTMQALADELPDIATDGNTVFPLFGATDNVDACFLSNEIARTLADKLGAAVKYAWFPYRPDNADDCALLKNTSYYKNVQALWNRIDLALVGIGNTDMLALFEKSFGTDPHIAHAAGDVATHFFDASGRLLTPHEHTLCASADHLRKAKRTVAIACGNNKVAAIAGALRTGLIDGLITDEYTAKDILKTTV